MSNRRKLNRPSRASDAVTIAYVHDVEVAHSWYRSMTDLLMFDIGTEARVIRGGYIAVRYSTGGIVAARNQAAAMFLEARDAEWLFWVDTDMGFSSDTLERLLAAADPEERPIMGALCYGFKELTPDGLGGYEMCPIPTVYDWVQLPDGVAGFTARHSYERDTVTRCSGTGSACILIHRSVLERLGPDPYEPLRNPTTGELLGEDLAFCARAAQHDIPIHVHTGVRTNHLKPIWVSEDVFAMWPLK